MSAATSVLLLDDGELESVRLLLEDLGAQFTRLRAAEATRSSARSAQLLITTARIGLRLERPSGSGPDRAVWIAFVAGDSKTQKSLLQKAGFDFLVREPVHPAALRVLVARALFRGGETRRAPRVACGHPVRYRSGLWPRSATLVDLSPRGCRLLTLAAPKEKSAISIALPGDLAGGRPLRLRGSVVRVSPADREGGAPGELSVGVRFGELDAAAQKRLRDVLAERLIGPVALGAALPFTPTTARPSASPAPGEATRTPRAQRLHRRKSYKKRVAALAGGDSYMILCRDLSVGGMRIERVDDLDVGAKLSLAVQLSAREEPVVVDATVVRDDGENGMALRFDSMAPRSEQNLKRLLATLPAIEALHDGARRQGTILARKLSDRTPPPGDT